jgi:hypothetical protein
VSNYGYSAPRFTFFQGDTFLLSGSERGSVFIWQLENGQLTQTDSSFLAIDEGSQSSIATGDLTGDGFPELICGNRAGGLTFYAGQAPSAQVHITQQIHVSTFPNPASHLLFLSGITEEMELEMVNVSGAVVRRFRLSALDEQEISLAGIPNGIYFLHFYAQHATFARKVIVQK